MVDSGPCYHPLRVIHNRSSTRSQNEKLKIMKIAAERRSFTSFQMIHTHTHTHAHTHTHTHTLDAPLHLHKRILLRDWTFYCTCKHTCYATVGVHWWNWLEYGNEWKILFPAIWSAPKETQWIRKSPIIFAPFNGGGKTPMTCTKSLPDSKEISWDDSEALRRPTKANIVEELSGQKLKVSDPRLETSFFNSETITVSLWRK